MPIFHIKGIFVSRESELNIAHLGQVFTPQNIVADMLKLIQSTKRVENPRFLEPSCGNGAFFAHLPNNKIGIEIDAFTIDCHDFATFNKVSKSRNDSKILNADFFAYPVSETFDTIIGNPPYVRYQDILDSTKSLLKPFSDILIRAQIFIPFLFINACCICVSVGS